jgi:hypothetical protein
MPSSSEYDSHLFSSAHPLSHTSVMFPVFDHHACDCDAEDQCACKRDHEGCSNQLAAMFLVLTTLSRR